MLHGWYSDKQSEYGTSYYSRPDGSEVEVTLVTQEKKHDTLWDDIVYIGEVTHWKRYGRPNTSEHVW